MENSPRQRGKRRKAADDRGVKASDRPYPRQEYISTRDQWQISSRSETCSLLPSNFFETLESIPFIIVNAGFRITFSKLPQICRLFSKTKICTGYVVENQIDLKC